MARQREQGGGERTGEGETEWWGENICRYNCILRRACLPAVPLDERKCYPVVIKGPSTIFTRLSVQDLEGIVATSAMSMVML